jgi:hypothetical protein
MKPLALLIVIVGLSAVASCHPLVTAPEKPAPPPCPPGTLLCQE